MGRSLCASRRFDDEPYRSPHSHELDVSGIPEAKVGTEAVVLGKQGGEEITPEEISETIGVPVIELAVRLVNNARRVYV